VLTSVPPYRLIDLKDSATYCHVVKLNATVLDLSRYTDVRQGKVVLMNFVFTRPAAGSRRTLKSGR
jgi:hypothetical protein